MSILWQHSLLLNQPEDTTISGAMDSTHTKLVIMKKPMRECNRRRNFRVIHHYILRNTMMRLWIV